jgi:hypothetical protein
LPHLKDNAVITIRMTAVNGIVFVGVPKAVEQFMPSMRQMERCFGQCRWRNGDHSSPAVTGENVYVSYACPQSYAFNAVTGQQLWHHDSCCQGGGGATPVVHDGRLYVRDDFCDPTSGLVLDANTENPIGGFDSLAPPAFIGNLVLYFNNQALVGVDVPRAD